MEAPCLSLLLLSPMLTTMSSKEVMASSTCETERLEESYTIIFLQEKFAKQTRSTLHRFRTFHNALEWRLPSPEIFVLFYVLIFSPVVTMYCEFPPIHSILQSLKHFTTNPKHFSPPSPSTIILSTAHSNTFVSYLFFYNFYSYINSAFVALPALVYST